MGFGSVFEPPAWSRLWDVSFTQSELSLSEKLEEPGLVGTEHYRVPPPSLAPAPHADWAFLLEGHKAGWGAQVARAGGLCSTPCICSHNCASPVWPHLTSPLPKQGLKEEMLQRVGRPSNVLLFAQTTVRNIFLVKLCLILCCSPETLLHTFTYS